MYVFVAILLLVSAMGTAIAENEEFTYFATLRLYPQGYIHDNTDAPIDARTALADLCFSIQPVVVILPEGTETGEDDAFVGARITFDKPFDVFLGEEAGFEFLGIPFGVIWEPKRVEIVGEVIYGVIVEIGDDYVIHDAFEPYGGQTARYTITPDTLLMWSNTSFQPGSGTGCQMIVDSDGIVLAMRIMHG